MIIRLLEKELIGEFTIESHGLALKFGRGRWEEEICMYRLPVSLVCH